MYKKLLFVLSFFYLSTFAFSQGSVFKYARQIVDTMASESMHGRGYVNDGDKIAANYIKTEFQKIGLKSFQEGYYQKFSFPINTFPSKMYVAIDGKELVPGKDYIVSERSGSGKGEYLLKKYTSNTDGFVDVPKKDKQYAVVVDDSKKEPIRQLSRGPIVYVTNKKLTQDLEWNYFNVPAIKLVDSIIPKDAKKIKVDIKNKFIPKYESQNVIGYVSGSLYPDSFIVFSAHFDHLGQMGSKVYFPGANDNASGCAMLLNLAKYYSLPENKPKYSIAFIAFAGEEVGLLGSDYFTKNPLFPLPKIKFVFNMDIMGTGEEGITVVNGSVFKTEFEKLKQINSDNNYIKDVKSRGKAANSDHYHFSEKGVKAFFIYTMGGIKAYHDIYDRAETLPLNEFENLFKLITQFGSYLQN
jgi:aminopeptidase YwaD